MLLYICINIYIYICIYIYIYEYILEVLTIATLKGLLNVARSKLLLYAFIKSDIYICKLNWNNSYMIYLYKIVLIYLYTIVVIYMSKHLYR
jgi:hypothetical protein